MVSQIVWLGVKDVFNQIAKDVIGQGLDHGRRSLRGLIHNQCGVSCETIACSDTTEGNEAQKPGTKRSKARKGKEAAGASGQVGLDGTNPTQVLPTQAGLVNNETGETMVLILPTEVQETDLNNPQGLGRIGRGKDNGHIGAVSDSSIHPIGEFFSRPGHASSDDGSGSSEDSSDSWDDSSGSSDSCTGDRKRKRDSAEEGRTSSGRPECSKCGKRHGAGTEPQTGFEWR
ncbi:hypothetical protein DY000_02048762 [Brassica cretica]|uniref:Uncharacterized protein n=1 Tax=Brassica cretica TaxID=69181 RepID=A0ABQ7F692_BRACR|nr:hypothetical protein DY000_02048762 [Brassica cretica]